MPAMSNWGDRVAVVDVPNSQRPFPARCARCFFVVAVAAIALETMPGSFPLVSLPRSWVSRGLAYLGLAQGEWPLFAPNPMLNNGWMAAEVIDRRGNPGHWTSPDWSKESAWRKFVGFRHLNYYQRLPRRYEAASDFVDYLQRSIPDLEAAEPELHWNEANEIVPSVPIQPPIILVRLYHFRNRMVLPADGPLPGHHETMWQLTSDLVLQRSFAP
jgi:hypothetical protein